MKDLRLFTGATEIGWLRVDSISGEGNLTIMETYKLNDRLASFELADPNYQLKVEMATEFIKIPKTFGDIIEFATEKSLVLVVQDSNSSEILVGGTVITEASPLSPSATQAVAYTNAITTSGSSGNIRFSVASGALPAGLTLSVAGTLAGTPTVSGTFSFSISVEDTVYSSKTIKQFTLVVAA